MSVFTSNPSNRLLKSSSIRTGRMATRHDYFPTYGSDLNPAPHALINFLLRIAAVIGLFLSAYFLFRPASSDLLAMPTDSAFSSASLSIESGTGTIARADGRLQSIATGATADVRYGDMIVAEDGRIELAFPHGQQLFLDPGASLTIEHIDIYDGIQQVQLVVWSGRVEYTTIAETRVEDYFYVSSTSSASQIDAGRIVLEVISPVETRYHVFEGTATIEMETQTVQVQADQHLDALLGDPLVVQLHQPESASDLTAATTQSAAEIEIVTTNAATTSSHISTAGQATTEFSNAVITHDVLAGDTMWSIAARYGVDINTIVIANPSITDTSLLQIGQRLYIPTSFAQTTAVGAN